ncbi:hypothetical protein [Paenibacillus aceris]|uniref:Uncharacterized protein n=1 Tax=Paenibacillus aceris TaxID=869555 RepID=A0ABS4I9P1_9BACL|nr:hypothetical protein [Paenibacillus aceris]MBP1967633.1 hypothetical protein [Paenibacillus aceris]NHW37502.1 hypothetical protein [Paenibacillus aceris]
MDFNTNELGQIGSKLYELSNTNSLIHSIYLLNDQKKLAFSSLSTRADLFNCILVSTF